MMYKQHSIHLLLLSALVLFTAVLPLTPLQVKAQIIPKPQQITMQQGMFTATVSTTLYTNLKGKERNLLDSWLQTLPLKLKNSSNPSASNVVKLMIAPIKSKNAEAYEMCITPSCIDIKANTGAGLFYAMQTLLQLSPDRTSLQAPCCEIIDEPRFGYRGFMLDVSRHFFSKDFILRQLDLMAYYKLNVFHFHLADTGGWRIEMKHYPQLTAEAAYRPHSEWQKHSADWEFCNRNTPNAYGGYYSQRDIRDIVAYAAVRHITVIPEIDMPGHSNEVLKALPQLACRGYNYKQSAELCLGKEATYKFCENILSELMKLFPAKYIHIGGDEADRSHWANCPDCKRLMQREGIKDVAKLQGYFTRRIEKFVNAHGKRIIGWDEILDGDVSKSATVMAWHPLPSSYKKSTEPGYSFIYSPLNALEMGHQVIMTPISHCYLDYTQEETATAARDNVFYLPLSDAYEYDPLPKGTRHPELMLGVQGNLWTEWVTTPERAEYMAYPRLMALAEVGWTQPEHKNYADFYRRVVKAEQRMKSQGYNSYNIDADQQKLKSQWKANHVILIGIDGWAAASMDTADMPTVKRMMREGCYTLKKRSVLPSASAINWASMMMGAGTEVTGYTKWNSKTPEIPSPAVTNHGIFPTIFTELYEQYPEAKTGALYDWDGIRYVIDTLAVGYNEYVPNSGVPDKTSGEIFPPYKITDKAVNYIKNEKPAFFFCYYGGVDESGHTFGWYTPKYYSYEKLVDDGIARLIQATKDTGIYDDTIFLVTGDHGGIGKGHGGITLKELEVPFVAFGKNIKRAGSFDQLMIQPDVAPTIAHIFNLKTPQYWRGRAMTQIFR